jgi:ketosteroid isomerase-like protein
MGALVGILAVTVLPLAARADKATMRKELTESLQRVSDLYSKKDIDALSQMMAPDVKLKLLKGKAMTRDQWEEQTKKELEHMDKLQMRFQMQRLTPKGDKEAVMLVRWTMQGTSTDEKGKPHQMRATGTERDTVVKTPDGWVLKASQELSNRMMMDGKPYHPKATTGKRKP